MSLTCTHVEHSLKGRIATIPQPLEENLKHLIIRNVGVSTPAVHEVIM